MVLPVDVGVGIAVQHHQLRQRGHAGIRIHQHRRQPGRFALDAAGAAHWCQELQIFDVVLFLGSTCAGLLLDCLLDTEHWDLKNTFVSQV